MRRVAFLLALLAAVVALGGCGDGEGPIESRVDARVAELRERVEADILERTEEVRREARKVRKDVAERVRKALEDLERTVPRAPADLPPPSSEGQTDPSTIDAFLTKTLKSVDTYWTQTLTANGREEPRVSYVWVPEGRRVRSGCGESADDTAAFYCPGDDTIYVGRRLASGVYDGVVEGFPGQQAGYGRAVGDFGVAYLIAHEYAHNLQQELGYFSSQRRGSSARPFELQADCLAGVWGASVYRAGLLKEGDVEEALNTALAVGDFEVGSEQHHGTPEERRDAWQLGFDSGEPRTCTAFVQAT